MNLTAAQLAQFAPPLRGVLQQLDAEGFIEGLSSGERCVDTEVRLIAEREAAHPGFVAGTYRETPTKDLVVAAIAALTKPANVPALEEAISGALAQGDPAEISRHLPNTDGLVEAVDLLPAGEGPLAARARVLVADAIKAGWAAPHSDVLTNEAGNICTHVQLWANQSS